VIRGDVNHIRIGRRSNVQDGTVVHVMHDTHPTVIGDEVTIGHGAIVHGCSIASRRTSINAPTTDSTSVS
jgi:carbonic anhydrase/acetyltransferase-like protein (isoleucine patch superfamily)